MEDRLAILGGQPVREQLLPYGKQWLDDEDIAAVIATLKSPFLTQGPEIVNFEHKVAQLAGTKYAVAFSNGTAALHGACFAAGIGPGDEVITTPLTFVASANCVLYQGGRPIFADIDGATYLMDIKACEEKITPTTKALIPVDLTGQPIDMDAYKALADKYGLVFIQDAAHSFGASFAGKPVGSVADMTMFSFHPVKPVTTGEGGVIVTNSPIYYEKLLLFRSHGITRDSNRLKCSDAGPWYYEMQALGYNYRMTDIQAALGSSQIKRLAKFIQRRQGIATQYNEALAPLAQGGVFCTPAVDSQAKSGWHLYVLRLQLQSLKATRRQIFDALRAENIGVNVHYIPVYYQPYYQDLGYPKGLCPVAEAVYDAIITLPLFPLMDAMDVQHVVKAVNKVIRHYQK